MNALTPNRILARPPAEVEHLQRAVAAMLAGTATEERLADEAFAAMWKLRDKLVAADRNIAACRVDEAIEHLQAACGLFVDAAYTLDRELEEARQQRPGFKALCDAEWDELPDRPLRESRTW